MSVSSGAKLRIESRLGLGGREISLLPAGSLRRRSDVDGTWHADGDEPSFITGPFAAADQLQPGWYRLRVRFDVEAGDIVEPCLYPDFGRPDDALKVIHLGEPDEMGCIDILVMFPWAVRALRFDPSIRPAVFRLRQFVIRRVGRVSALWSMFDGVARTAGPWRGRSWVSAWLGFARDTRRLGLSGATRPLYRRYRDASILARVGYPNWTKRYDTLSAIELEGMSARVDALAWRPRISVLVPVYDTPAQWLDRCIGSVRGQVYPDWELCIADDASPSPHVRRVLERHASEDARIKLVFREENGHISAASNSALEACTGDYVGLLDHDDELRPHALLEMAEAISRNPQLKLLYSDEDKLDESGDRFDPYFKPDWNPDLLCSQNYLCHFSVISAALMREVGGFREGFEGSQDHDLLLRCTERLDRTEIHHVPKVLYHWRAIAGSTALVRDAKDYASQAGARAVRDHLQRIDAAAELVELPHGHYRVRWRLPVHAPKVNIIVPTRDRPELLQGCVASILERTAYPSFELIVVDNQSRDPEALTQLDVLARDSRVRVLRYDASFNFSAINNWAVAQSNGELVCLLNNDIELIHPDWLDEMASQALRPEIGAVGAMLYYPDDRIQHAGAILGIGGVANHAYLGLPRGYPGHGGRALVVQELSAVTAACMVLRRSVYDEVGGLDENLQVAFNDIDFCLRIREAGYRNLWTPFAELYHHESASRGQDDTPEKYARFISEVELMEQRWGARLRSDPAYNPNLSLLRTDFGFAFPPRER